MQNLIKFQDKELELVNIDGKAYMRSSDVARALDYRRSDIVTKLYHNHADEFTPDMTFNTELVVKGYGNGNSKRPVRVFSLRGCHLIAMLANTPVAKAFRSWCLDILEGKIILPFGQSAAPALDAKAIGGIVKKCASKAIKDELAVLPAPSFNPQVLKTEIETEITDFERRRCIGMAVTPQEKSLIEAIRNDYYIAVGKVYRAALDAIKS